MKYGVTVQSKQTLADSDGFFTRLQMSSGASCDQNVTKIRFHPYFSHQKAPQEKPARPVISMAERVGFEPTEAINLT